MQGLNVLTNFSEAWVLSTHHWVIKCMAVIVMSAETRNVWKIKYIQKLNKFKVMNCIDLFIFSVMFLS